MIRTRRRRRAGTGRASSGGAAALALALSLHALAPAAAIAQGRGAAVKIDHLEETLPNGLRVVYHVDHATPMVAVDVWYKVGSRDEQAGRTGFAHLFEHVMFQGSKNVPKGQHFALLEQVGARAGSDVNGTTQEDRTNYFESLPSNQVELALWLESDRMSTLADALTQENLDLQREVVKNERRAGYDNRPYGTAVERLLALAFPEGHPYHHPVIGSMEDLSAATLGDVQGFFRTHYVPNNAVLVIAGDIEVSRLKSVVRKYFAGIPRGAPGTDATNSGASVAALPKTIGEEKRAVVEDAAAPAPAAFVAYRMPAATSKSGAAVALLGDILAAGQTGALYASLVHDRQVAVQIGAFTEGLRRDADMIGFYAVGKRGASGDSLESALVAQLDAAAAAITQESLDRVRAGRRFRFVNDLQGLGGFGGRADRLAEGVLFYDDPDHVNKVLAEYDAVTVDDLKALVAERLVATNRIRLLYLPKGAPTSSAASTTSASTAAAPRDK